MCSKKQFYYQENVCPVYQEVLFVKFEFLGYDGFDIIKWKSSTQHSPCSQEAILFFGWRDENCQGFEEIIPSSKTPMAWMIMLPQSQVKN